MRTIYSDSAPHPAGHYSQAIEHNGLIFVSGQLPVDPSSSNKEFKGIEAQVVQALKNIQSILSAEGCSMEDIIRVTIYISDIALWERVNKAYGAFLGSHKPARTIVPSNELHFGFNVEIDAIAASRK